MQANTKEKIAIITPPFAGHYGVLLQLAQTLMASRQDVVFTMVITGWGNVKLDSHIKSLLEAQGLRVIELLAAPLNVLSPYDFTFSRVFDLMPALIEICQDHDYFIYDIFSLEGYIVGHHLKKTAICSVPSIMGPFNPKQKIFCHALLAHAELIKQLELQYDLDIYARLESVGDGFFIASDQKTLQWSWPRLIEADDYTRHRRLTNPIFMRPQSLTNKMRIQDEKKRIYFSLGTVITGHLWEHIPSLRVFVQEMIHYLVKHFGDHDDYEVIISTGRQVSDILTDIPNNFKAHERVDQVSLLREVDLFITHGGGNSVNEAIDASVPMVVIPFFGDQHQSAANIQQLKIGLAFLQDDIYLDECLNAASGRYARSSLTEATFIEAIVSVLYDASYRDALRYVRKSLPVSLDAIYFS